MRKLKMKNLKVKIQKKKIYEEEEEISKNIKKGKEQRRIKERE